MFLFMRNKLSKSKFKIKQNPILFKRNLTYCFTIWFRSPLQNKIRIQKQVLRIIDNISC